jgi:hypothetical protein
LVFSRAKFGWILTRSYAPERELLFTPSLGVYPVCFRKPMEKLLGPNRQAPTTKGIYDSRNPQRTAEYI